MRFIVTLAAFLLAGPALASPVQDHLDNLIEQDKAPALFTAAGGKQARDTLPKTARSTQ